MCQVLKVSRSGFYSWLKREPSRRTLYNRRIVDQLKQMHSDDKQCYYGSPRATAELRRQGYRVSRPRVARLMKAHRLRARRRRSYKRTTQSNHHLPVATHWLNRHFSPDQLNQVWAGDITYIRTMEGWMYLTVVMDLADRQVIGWSTSEGMHATNTSIAAWRQAIAARGIIGPVLFHSDRGVQYSCHDFITELASAGDVSQSMARKGNCWDNAVVESFFKTLKNEVNPAGIFASRVQARLAIFEYIECWYNRHRLHSSLGYRSPVEQEQWLRSQNLIAA